MYLLIKAELLKQKGSFSKKLVWLAPIVIILLASFLMGGRQVQKASYNWWYILMLPIALTMISSFIITKEKKRNFHGMLSELVDIKKLWYSKIAVCTIYLALSCLIFFIVITASSFLIKADITIGKSFSASILLFILFVWQIPLWMYISMKINTGFSVVLSHLCNSGIAVIFGITDMWWIPFSIPARVMIPVIGVLPNGLSADVGSSLLNSNVILIGVAITLVLYITLSYLTAKLFERKEV